MQGQSPEVIILVAEGHVKQLVGEVIQVAHL